MSVGQIYDMIVKKESITKGWSEDKKYCVTTTDGKKYLLRISDISTYETKKSLFSMMKKIAEQDIPMCLPVEFGICSDGVYSIQSWINGVDLETVLPLGSENLLPEMEQYALGVQAGKILKKIHALPISKPREEWEVIFNRRIDDKIQEYHKCGLSFAGDDKVLAYIQKTRYLLKNRGQCFLLGDYNVLNMMYENGDLKIIDFDRYEIGDPWDEFNCIAWSAMASPHFATGQLDGYFDGEPPMEFFELFAVYTSILLLSLLSSWAVTSKTGHDATMKLSQGVLKWFDNMQNPVPSWYLKNVQV